MDGRWSIVVAAAIAVIGGAAVGDDGGEACLEGKLERAEGWASLAWDEATGRNARNYPPDRLVDYLHMKLQMRFESLDEPRFTARETLRVRPISAPVEGLVLDAVGLDVQHVEHGGAPVEFFVGDETIALRFDPPLSVNADHEIVFDYACERPYAGMFFTPAAPDMPGYTAEVHTQGQSITNRHWFVAHDSPNDMLTTELVVDVPAGNQVSSNGRLVAREESGDRAVWHYLQDKPHVSYLVALVIGQFDLVEIPHDRVPMQVWVPKGLGHLVPGCYGRTGAMIDVFERRFGVPYPWDRYDQLVVKSFGAGGMENTSATTMYPTAILDEVALRDGDLDGLIAHELAHQWSGDMLTCKEWAHIWLNEGFATYGSALWSEARDGEDGYLNSMRRNFTRVTFRDRTTNELPMVSSVYDHPGETFSRAANPYPKGAAILHMLRRMLGEDVFWRGMHTYMQRHAHTPVETHDFRYAMEEVSGRGLEWFFDQWCRRPGVPELKVVITYDAPTRELVAEVAQTQQIDARTPAFRFTLPILVRTRSGDTTHEVELRGRATTFRTTLDGAPELVVVDPWLDVLGRMDVEKTRGLWMAQVQHGPTLPARHRAIRALGDTDLPGHHEALAAVIADDGVHDALRVAAVSSLRGFGSEDAHARALERLDAGVDDPRVRVALVRALVDHDDEDARARLAELASSDPSYDVRVAAIGGLEKLDAKEHADLVVELVAFPSQHDKVRNAALDALVAFDDPRGLDLAIEYARYGYMDRSRPQAVATIGELGHHDPDRALEALLGYLSDPQRRPARAAGAALADLGDERAIDPISRIAETHPDPRRREAAEDWLEKLRKGDEKS